MRKTKTPPAPYTAKRSPSGSYITVLKHPQPQPLAPSDLEKLCRHLQLRQEPSQHFGEASNDPEETISETDAVTRYYCRLTKELCVGSVPELDMNQLLLDAEVVCRCPSLSSYKKR